MSDELNNEIVEVDRKMIAEYSDDLADHVGKFMEQHKIPLNEAVIMLAYVLLYASEQTDVAMELLNEERTAMVFVRSEGRSGGKVAAITDDEVH